MEKIIVVARYNEDLNWVSKTQIPYIIYNKGEENIDLSYISIPNEGREGETYLKYIIDNYDNLPDYIIFCQGNPFDHCSDFNNKILNKTDGFIPLSNFEYISNQNGEPHHSGLNIGETYAKIFGKTQDTFTFYPGAQFIVSKNLILNKSIKTWKKIYSIYNESSGSPWVFERLWPFIWNYSEIN
jgi:hypothetical protein